MSMQFKVLSLAVACVLAGLPAVAGSERHGVRPDRDGRRHGWPGVVVEPNIIIERGGDRGPNVDDPAFIMAELGRCAAGGVRLFVDCLRHNHRSIMIRRLEACVRSETIPDDPARVEACLPLPPP
jgi:hypothetical protein